MGDTQEKAMKVCVEVSKFRLYLAVKLFILQTDHQPLTCLKDAKFWIDRFMRWALALRQYDYNVRGILGKDNVDDLSHLIFD